MRGHNDTNWTKEHQKWIVISKEKRKYVLIGQLILGKIEHMSHYMNWYRANSKICLTWFATYPNVAATSRSAPQQSPSVVATEEPLLQVNQSDLRLVV